MNDYYGTATPGQTQPKQTLRKITMSWDSVSILDGQTPLDPVAAICMNGGLTFVCNGREILNLNSRERQQLANLLLQANSEGV